MDADTERTEGKDLRHDFRLSFHLQFSVSFGVLLSRMRFAEKLTVMFSVEVLGDELDRA